MQRARVLWAGITEGQQPLQALAQAVEEAMQACGFAPEDRPFRGHLTLGRVKLPGHGSQLAEQLALHATERFGEMCVSEIRLMRSELLPHGARYTVLHRWILGGEAEAIE